MWVNVIWFLSMDYLKSLFEEPSPKENAFCISICIWICFFEWERVRGEATISTLRSSNHQVWALNTIIHGSGEGGQGRESRKCCPKPNYCLGDMRGLGEGEKMSQKIIYPYTWVPILNHPSVLGAVSLDEVDFLTSEVCFPSPDLFDMISGRFMLHVASNV